MNQRVLTVPVGHKGGSGVSQGLGWGHSWEVALAAGDTLKPRAAPRAGCKVRTRREYSVCSVPVGARLCLLPPSRILGFQALPKAMESTAKLRCESSEQHHQHLCEGSSPLLLAYYPSRSISDCSVSWNCKEAARSHLGGRANIKPPNSFFSPFVNEENMQVLSRADFSVHLHTLEKSAFN